MGKVENKEKVKPPNKGNVKEILDSFYGLTETIELMSETFKALNARIDMLEGILINHKEHLERIERTIYKLPEKTEYLQ